LRIRLAGEEGTPAPSTSGELEAKGMGPGTELDAEAMARRQAAAQGGQGRRPVQRRALPASQAFDAMRQQQVQAQRMRAAQQAQATQQEGGDKEAAPAKTEAAPAEAAGFEGVGRNDACPCGSGKKFKKCHGKAEA
jgi:uncharacterized protein YecA (UPF0149 family)